MPGRRQTMEGIVVSDKMQKTVVVAVDRWRAHPLYKKLQRRTKRYKAHDETNSCHVGDRVLIEAMRPLSKEKRWRVAQILTRGEVPEIAPEAIDSEIIGETVEAHEREDDDDDDDNDDEDD